MQFILGDSIARSVFHKQPVKFAAMEIVRKTDTRVPEYLFGRLNEDGTVSGGIKIPLLDSVLAGFSPHTEVVGLTSVPADQRPTATQATIAHWAFDIMVLIGSVLVLLALWYGLVWLRHRRLPASKWFYRSAACAGAGSVVAVECGWIATEVGRQPWIVYQNMRVAEAVTSTRSTSLWIMLGAVMVVYVFLFGSFLAVLLKMRTRWRLADELQAVAGTHTPEADIPYGPRASVPAGDAPAAGPGAGRSGGDGP
ncbi:cytochrome ubiquinol oxidase subunit I [Streptomyces sp. NPDC055400]